MEMIRQIITEFLLEIWYVVGGFFDYFFPQDSVNPHSTQKRPIVFVHAWMTQNFPYRHMKRYFEERGYRMYITNFGWHLGGTEENARKLRGFIDERELKDVILIGISGGAVISLYYLQKLEGWKQIDTFVSLGGPLKGANLALFASWFSRAAQQMIPGSIFMKELLEVKVPRNKRMTCISAKWDNLVPSWSNKLEGAKSVVVDVIGHVNLQFSAKTYQVIEQEISRPAGSD